MLLREMLNAGDGTAFKSLEGVEVLSPNDSAEISIHKAYEKNEGVCLRAALFQEPMPL
jgi:hypothetical protein